MGLRGSLKLTYFGLAGGWGALKQIYFEVLGRGGALKLTLVWTVRGLETDTEKD